MADRISKQLEAAISILSQAGTAGAAQQNPYLAARVGFGSQGVSVPYAPGYGTVKTGKQGYVQNSMGQILYSNGVIYDPAAHTLTFPTPGSGIDPTEVEGSEEWLHKIQTTWTATKANQWRKRLLALGFDRVVTGGIAKTGGMAMDLIEGLRQYHSTRYSNFGTVQALSPQGGSTESPKDIRKSIDFESLTEEVRGWGQVPFGEDLSRPEAKYFAGRMVTKMAELQRNHPDWTEQQISSGATSRVQREFLDQPEVEDQTQQQDELEGNTSLRKNIVSAFQLGSV